MSEVIVQLNWAQIYSGAIVGIMRQVQNIDFKSRDRYGRSNGADWQDGIESCLAEMAVANYLGLYWDGNIGNYNAPDVGPYQVRHTSWPNGCLLLHKQDKDEEACVLAIGKNGHYRLAGWAWIGEMKKDEYWMDKGNGRPCYFVPQTDLRPMAELKAITWSS